MNHHQPQRRRPIRHSAYRKALQRLDETLAENQPGITADKIDRIRLRLFGCLAACERSAGASLPP